MKKYLLMAAGMLLVCSGVAVTDQKIEAFAGAAPHALAWGPTLFRFLLALHGLILIAAGLTQQTNADPVERVKRSEGGRVASNFQFDLITWISLGLMGALALVLRVWHLNSDLWVDEVFTLLDFCRAPLGEILTRFPSQNQHMLLSIVSHLSITIFGESAWALRLPSVLFGVASIWALFLLGRFVLGRTEAFFAAGLMCVSYHHVWFSQNARGYMGLLLFSLLATWFWFEATRRNSWTAWLAYVAAVCLGMWIHMTMAFVVAAHAAVYFGAWFFPSLSRVHPGSTSNLMAEKSPSEFRPCIEHWRTFSLRPIAALFLCATVSLQLYALALPEFIRVGMHEKSLDSEWTNPLWVIAESVRSFRTGWMGLIGILLIFGGCALVGAGWLDLFRRQKQAAIIMVLPALLAGGTMIALGHNLWPRFFFFSMGFVILITVHGAFVAPRMIGALAPAFNAKETWIKAVGLTAAALMILASVMTLPRNYALPKQDFSGARQYVEQHRSPGDAVIAVGLAGIMYTRYFAPQWAAAQTRSEFDEISRQSNSIWIVYTLPIEVRAYRPEMWQIIENNFEVVKIFPGTLGGGEVFVCRPKGKEFLSQKLTVRPPASTER